MHNLARQFMAAFILAALVVTPAMAAAPGLVPPTPEERDVIDRLEAAREGLLSFSTESLSPLFGSRDMPLPPEECRYGRMPRIFGLLIGAHDPGPDMMRLKGPQNDVELIASSLASFGAAAEDLHLLVGRTASREGLVEAAWTVLSNLECGDKVFIYFGGHALESYGPLLVSPDLDLHALRSQSQTHDSQPDGGFPRRRADIEISRLKAELAWHLDSGIVMMLNGDGELDRAAGRTVPTGFETFNAADLSELVTLLRNHRADVTVVLDTNYASQAGLLERQDASSGGYWSVDLAGAAAQADPVPREGVRSSTLSSDAGALAAFYSSVGDGLSIEASFAGEDGPVSYGLFTFRVAEALLNRQDASVREISEAINRIVLDDPRTRMQVHRIEASDPAMRILALSGRQNQRTDTIRILSPAVTRGAASFEVPSVEIVGMLDWHAPARAVLVEGQPASLRRDGRFSATVALRPGVNTVSVTGLTADNEIHLMPPLEFVYDGDLKKLAGAGRRFALIVANQNYLPETRFSTLRTPVADAEALRDVLTRDYGFETTVRLAGETDYPLFLVDAGKEDIEDALYTLGQVAGEQDTVLVYYAGHGVFDERTTNASWVPVDATRPYNYLSGAAITEHIQRIVARSVILISDSCYSGALRSGADGDSRLATITEEDRTLSLQRMSQKTSRILITSGGTEPVLDEGGDGHSVFARALLTGLRKMEKDAFASEELYRDYIMPMVAGRVDQVPERRPIERAGHDPAADMVFVRLAASAGE